MHDIIDIAKTGQEFTVSIYMKIATWAWNVAVCGFS